MKKLITILILFWTVFVHATERFSYNHTWLHPFATNWYVDNTAGGTNSGTLANPWTSLASISWGSISPDDSILLKAGDSFNEKFTIGASGTSGHPIIIGRYGSGADPIITGFTSVSAWTNTSGNIWHSTSTVTSSTSLNLVTVGGALQPMGRYPKATDANSGYLSFQSHSGTSSITSTAISGAPYYSGGGNFIGGEVVIRSNHFVLNRGRITAQTNNTVTYTPLSSADAVAPTDGYGFFFQNDSVACTVQNEWAYDSTNRKLIMYSSGTPSNVKVANIDTLINVGGKSYVTFGNLDIQGANIYLVWLGLAATSNHITFSSCDFSFSGVNAMYSQNELPHDITVTNCTFNHINNTAIDAEESTYFSVTNSSFKNIGIIAGMGKSGQKMYGVQSLGNNSTFQYNIIDSTGYTSVSFKGSSVTIDKNYVQHFCSVIDDGAGIYTPGLSTGTGSVVSSNISIKGIGAPNGTDGENIAHGIYMDDNTTGVTIKKNTTYGCPGYGIYLHKNTSMTVQDNNSYDNTLAQILYSDATGVMAGLTVTRNTFFSKTSSELTAQIQYVAGNPVSAWGTLDSNNYCRPIAEPSGISNGSITQGVIDYELSGTDMYKSLDSYQSASSQDAHSQKTFRTVTSPDSLLFVYNPTDHDSTITLSANYNDINQNEYDGTITLSQYSSSVLLYLSDLASSSSDTTRRLKYQSPTLRVMRSGSLDDYNPFYVPIVDSLILHPYSSKILIYKSKATATVLPVSLLNFNTSISGNILKVTWSTVSESNNDHFDIQTSTDGINWKTVKTVKSLAPNGNSSQKLNYSTQIILQ